MHNELNALLKEGVIIHTFSDLSGIAFYNSHSNEVLNMAASAEQVYDCYNKFIGMATPVDEDVYTAFISLNEKGLFKKYEVN